MPRRTSGKAVPYLLVWILVGVGLIALGVGVYLPRAQAARPGELQQGPLNLYLPLSMRSFPPPATSFGAEIHAYHMNNSSLLDQASQSGMYFVRSAIFDWSRLEPDKTDPPTYHFEIIDGSALANVNYRGLKTIAMVKYAPTWARQVPDKPCGPIIASELGRFAQFMQEVVSRYSVPPYNIKYWEIGNEPDVDPSFVPVDLGYGCWGDLNDEYYGGGYYAEMLKQVYPAIKAADPQAQVLIGGLLLDCDPENPPEGQDCKSSKFLEGILRHNGALDGGNYFDIVSFHGYPPYMNIADNNGKFVSPLGWDEHYPKWEKQTGDDGIGGVVMGKIHFLRNVLSRYGVSKPLMHTEGALICPDWNPTQCNPPGNAFYESQADYVVWLYVRNWAANVNGTTWYSFENSGWRYSSMLDELGKPKLVLKAFTFMTHYLGGANYVGTVTQYPELRGYEFSTAGKRIWVLWAPDEQPYTITLPSGTRIVYDKYGNNITPVGNSMMVSRPIYVEIIP